MGRDQGDVAARLVWRGAGLAVSSRSKPASVCQAVQQILGNPRFREEARRIAKRMAHAEGDASAIGELEALPAS
jgi:UDP:flavonoid glycosyltransferase YjiC (YdhE family)